MVELIFAGVFLLAFSAVAFGACYAATDYMTGSAPKWADYAAYFVKPTLVTGLISLTVGLVFLWKLRTFREKSNQN